MKLHLILTYMLIFNILAIHSQTERVNGKIIKDFGQTASYRDVTKENSNPDIKFALSAMTALIQYQNNGYRFIKF